MDDRLETGKRTSKVDEEFVAPIIDGETNEAMSEAPVVAADRVDDQTESQPEFEITPEMETKLIDLKYMLDHWHDPDEIINPEKAKGSATGTYASEVLKTDEILENRPVYFHETTYENIKKIHREGIKDGSIGITPFFWSGFGKKSGLIIGSETKIEYAQVYSESDYDENIKLMKTNNLESFRNARAKYMNRMCLIITGQDAKNISDIAKADDNNSKGSYNWFHGEIGNVVTDDRKRVTLAEYNIKPSGVILGVSSPDLLGQEPIEKRLRKLQAAEETLKYLKENNLPRISRRISSSVTDIDLTQANLEAEIERTKKELETLQDYDKVALKRSEMAEIVGKEIVLPVFDLGGNLLWPRQMSHEEVKQFVADREVKKKDETSVESVERPEEGVDLEPISEIEAEL